MKAFKYIFSLFLFAIYYYMFARRYVEKYREGGVIKTNHEEIPANITPPGFVLTLSWSPGSIILICSCILKVSFLCQKFQEREQNGKHLSFLNTIHLVTSDRFLTIKHSRSMKFLLEILWTMSTAPLLTLCMGKCLYFGPKKDLLLQIALKLWLYT